MLRSALSMSAVTGEDFLIRSIRGSRPDPGLKRQHLEAVKAASRICNAEVSGLELGSTRLEFRPDPSLDPSPFTSNIGTAGSITLLVDTLLPVTSQLNDGFRFTARGGTDVKWSPSFSYLREVKLPLLSRFGVEASVELERTGFYPAGNGKATLSTEPHSLEEIELVERGELQRFEVYSRASRDLENRDVADRQADEAARRLKNSHVSAGLEKDVRYVDADSTGSVLLVKAVYENSVAGFDALGERDKRSETVAGEAVDGFKSFHSSGAAVDRYMSDQLLVFLAIAGGELKIPEITDHVQTNIEVLESFGRRIETGIDGGNPVLVSS